MDQSTDESSSKVKKTILKFFYKTATNFTKKPNVT